MNHPPRYAEAPRQHHPDAIFVNQSAPPDKLSITKMTVPVILVMTGAVALMYGTYLGTSELSGIKNSIENLSRDVKTYSETLSARVDRLEYDVQARTASRWTRQQHEWWCARTELVNSAIGWKCADDVPSRVETNAATGANVPTVNGWAARRSR